MSIGNDVMSIAFRIPMPVRQGDSSTPAGDRARFCLPGGRNFGRGGHCPADALDDAAILVPRRDYGFLMARLAPCAARIRRAAATRLNPDGGDAARPARGSLEIPWTA